MSGKVKLWMFFIVATVCFMIPGKIKAGVQITGGQDKNSAVTVQLDQEYTTTGTEGWFKITAPENTKYIGMGYDEYTDVDAYHEDGDRLSFYWLAYGSYYETDLSEFGSKELGDYTQYWDNIGSREQDNRIRPNEEYYFYISTSKAEYCTFQIVCGGSPDSAQTVSLNETYSWYSHIRPTTRGDYAFSYGYAYWYQFTAPKTAYYKVALRSVSKTAKYNDYTAKYQVTYKDGTSIAGAGCRNNEQTESVFQAKQGMTYLIGINPDYGDNTVEFYVSDVPVSAIHLNSANLTMTREEKFLLEASVFPQESAYKETDFSSSNPVVASVSEEGWITAKSAGTALITCKAKDGSGVYAQCQVTVKPIYVEKVDLSECIEDGILQLRFEDYYELYYDDEVIDAEIIPRNVDNQGVIWTSSDPNVVIVKSVSGYSASARLEVKGTGTAVITCKAIDGSNVSASFWVNVVSDYLGTNGSSAGAHKFTVSGIKYKVTSINAKGGTVTVTGVKNKSKKSYSIPAKIKEGSRTYQVTAISGSAFSGCKKAENITLGSNIATIGKKAFYNCKKLKNLTVKSKKIKSVGSNAFKNIFSKAKIKVPFSKLGQYKKLFQKKGQKSSVKIKKI